MRPAGWSQLIREPCSWKNRTSFSTSVIAGTFSSVTGSSVSSVAHRIGSIEFLLPEGRMVPERGLPPLTIRSAMERFVVRGKKKGARGGGRP